VRIVRVLACTCVGVGVGAYEQQHDHHRSTFRPCEEHDQHEDQYPIQPVLGRCLAILTTAVLVAMIRSTGSVLVTVR